MIIKINRMIKNVKNKKTFIICILVLSFLLSMDYALGEENFSEKDKASIDKTEYLIEVYKEDLDTFTNSRNFFQSRDEERDKINKLSRLETKIIDSVYNIKNENSREELMKDFQILRDEFNKTMQKRKINTTIFYCFFIAFIVLFPVILRNMSK